MGKPWENHGKTLGKWWFNAILWVFNPLVNVYITNWKDPPGKTHHKYITIFNSYVTQQICNWQQFTSYPRRMSIIAENTFNSCLIPSALHTRRIVVDHLFLFSYWWSSHPNNIDHHWCIVDHHIVDNRHHSQVGNCPTFLTSPNNWGNMWRRCPNSQKDYHCK